MASPKRRRLKRLFAWAKVNGFGFKANQQNPVIREVVEEKPKVKVEKAKFLKKSKK